VTEPLHHRIFLDLVAVPGMVRVQRRTDHRWEHFDLAVEDAMALGEQLRCAAVRAAALTGHSPQMTDAGRDVRSEE
jgi:hypothetical protein